MAYEDYMLESIKKVEASRPKRVKEVYKRLTAEEIEEVLNKYHPDYKKDTKHEFKFGPSKGDKAPNEFLDLIEANPLINPEQFDLEKVNEIFLRLIERHESLRTSFKIINNFLILLIELNFKFTYSINFFKTNFSN